MIDLLYCGNNSYGQCCLNNSTSPKIIYELSFALKENIETIQATHRFLIIKIANRFQVHGMTNESDNERVKHFKLPINCKSYLGTDDFILLGNIYEFWKSDYSDQWKKFHYTWESEEEEKLWRENKNEIIKFSSSNDCIYCLLNEGSVWKLKENRKIKLLYSPEVDKAIDIASGFEHLLILTESGCVLSFGIGSRGQLGHGDLNPASTGPLQISALIGLKVIKVAASGWHSCALTDSGDLYTWGWNNFGQLGFPSDDDCNETGIGLTAEPLVVDFQEDIRDVDCGTRHTVIITVNNDLYATGWNSYGQLGIGNTTEKVHKFTKVKNDFKGNKKLICGPWCTLLLLADKTNKQIN